MYGGSLSLVTFVPYDLILGFRKH